MRKESSFKEKDLAIIDEEELTGSLSNSEINSDEESSIFSLFNSISPKNRYINDDIFIFNKLMIDSQIQRQWLKDNE